MLALPAAGGSRRDIYNGAVFSYTHGSIGSQTPLARFEMTESENNQSVEPQDDPEVVGTLESFNARVEVNNEGWVWRVFLYEKGGCDEALDWVRKLPEVKELWVIHTKVTKEAVDALQEEMPDLVIYR